MVFSVCQCFKNSGYRLLCYKSGEWKRSLAQRFRILWVRKEIKLGAALMVQWLCLSSQCVGPGFNPWSGNQIPYAATKTWHSRIDKQILRGENGELSSSYTLSRTLVVCARRHHFSVRETFPSSVSHQGRFSIEFVFRFCSNSRHLWAWKFLVDDKTLEKSLE